MEWGSAFIFLGAIALGLGLLVRAIIRTQERSSENDSSVPRGPGNYPPDVPGPH